MGAAAEAALNCSTVVRSVLDFLSVEDLFSCARYDLLWEQIALQLLKKKLRFFALLQDIKAPFLNVGLVDDLQWRLCIARRAGRRPKLAIVFCSDKRYEADSVASCFPEDSSVVQIDVRGPIWGHTGSPTGGLCVLVLFETPGVQFQCESSPWVVGTQASAALAQETLGRLICVNRKPRRYTRKHQVLDNLNVSPFETRVIIVFDFTKVLIVTFPEPSFLI
ncbi:uncharacterized protein LOC144153483 [Haemaphysalis longicornis]